MAKPSRYYLGRVTKLGEMTSQLLIRILRDPPIITVHRSRFTVTSVEEVMSDDGRVAIYGVLAKYRPDGEVRVVDPTAHAVRPAPVQDLLWASSDFVYVPSLSGIAYRHVSASLPRETFRRVFSELVASSEHTLLGSAEINAISDLRTFVRSLAHMDTVNTIFAKVRPPNPLFGPLWESLFQYVKSRGLDSLSVSETSIGGIATSLPVVAAAIDETGSIANSARVSPSMASGSVADSAVLMAADGYGEAVVSGTADGIKVAYATYDDQRSFSMAELPSPTSLANEAIRQLLNVNDQRGLQH